VIVEKPFGRDLASAKQLNRDLKQILDEQQIYRIDHYLGKETVQNLMVFRFANAIAEPLWNRNFIDKRTDYRRRDGRRRAARRLLRRRPGPARHGSQSSFQLLSLTAMEPRFRLTRTPCATSKRKSSTPFKLLKPQDVISMAVRGQYGQGVTGEERLPAYRTEPMVSPASNTETYAALRLEIDNWRWAGVPFYLRTGKRLRGASRKSPSSFAVLRSCCFEIRRFPICRPTGWSFTFNPMKESHCDSELRFRPGDAARPGEYGV